MKSKEYENLLSVSNEIGLPTKKILDMFALLIKEDSFENNELLRRLGVSRNVLNQVKAKLQVYFGAPSQTTSLSKEGRTRIGKIKGFLNEPEEFLLNLDSGKIKSITGLVERHRGKRPEPERNYDQFTATEETTAKRACLMDFFADIKEKRILFLGDDDFTSLGAASLGSSLSIQVLDIDERILKGISQAGSEEGLEIAVARYDARQKLPVTYKGKFDVVFTDLPYTNGGVKLFLSRGIDALDPNNQAARIYFCYGNSDRAKEKFLPIYQIVTESGLMMRWVFDKFNRYEGAESIGSSSSLFVCDVTPKTQAPIKGDFNGQIYTND